MSDEDDSEKTEEPNHKKLEDAREKGQVPSSKEVNHWVIFLAATIFLLGLAPPLAQEVSRSMVAFLERPHEFSVTAQTMPIIVGDALSSLGMAVLPTAALFLVAAAAAGLLQTGLLFSTESITPKLEKISPIAGVKRMFSVKSLAEFGKGILKLIIVGAIAAGVIMPEMAAIETVSGMGAADLINKLASVSARLVMAVLAIMTLIASVDFIYQRWEHMKKLRMSRQDMKEEYKQTEGDPLIKQRLRQIRMDRARKRMMAEVPKADVVITNPTHFALALKYDTMVMNAPMVLAKGVDKAAFRIREVAEEHGIPIIENPPLARGLYANVGLEEEIDEEHYRAVAEVINYVWKLRGRKG